MKIHYLIIIGLLVMTHHSIHATDIERGKTISQNCVACHGADGNSHNPIWPKIAGQHANYIIKQLHDFKSGVRLNAQMQPIAATLSDQDIKDVAAYFARQKSTYGKAKRELIELGEKIYHAGNTETLVVPCKACHGPSGAGNPAANYPAIAGQHAEYTKKRLMAFRANEQRDQQDQDSQNVMYKVADSMTTAEIEAVAEYIQGLHGASQ